MGLEKRIALLVEERDFSFRPKIVDRQRPVEVSVSTMSSLMIRFVLLAYILALPFAVAGQTGNFETVKVADGVYAAIRKEPHGLTTNANSVFIINDADVIVVDTTLTPGTATELLSALRKLTDKPVRYVINTHWHDDHIMGNQVFRDAFPAADFIAHARTLEYLPTTGLKNRQNAMSEQGYPQFIKALRDRLEKGESRPGQPLNDEERSTLSSDIKIAEAYMKENPTARVVLPTMTVEDKLTIHRGGRVVNILYFGRGHTSGDLVVHLPKEGVVIAGDLVIWPVPYVGAPQSHPGDWSETLEKIVALNPKFIVPGHGPVMNDSSYLKLMAELFRSIRQQVEASVARGDDLDQTRRSIDLKSFRQQFAGESRVRNMVFNSYVIGSGVEAAFLDVTAKKQSP